MKKLFDTSIEYLLNCSVYFEETFTDQPVGYTTTNEALDLYDFSTWRWRFFLRNLAS